MLSLHGRLGRRILLGTVLSLLAVLIGIHHTIPDSPPATTFGLLKFMSSPFASLDTSSSSSPSSRLKPRQPPTTCETCLLEPDNPLCEYGIDAVRQSRGYQGSGYRVRKFMEKALKGDQVQIAVLGGSVTEGHGCRGVPRWHETFFENFRKDFPNSVLHDGPVPGTNSEVLSYCFESTVPRDADLYLVEMDVNNLAVPNTRGDDDALFRALLGLPQAPAVVRAGVIALAFPDMVLGRESALVNGQYFDVPVISVANFLLPHIIEYPELRYDFFARNNEGGLDLRHVSNITHNALGDMMTLYFQEQACETQRRLLDPPPPVAKRWPQESRLGSIPRLPVYSEFNTDEFMPNMESSCAMAGSPRRPLEPLTKGTTKEWAKVEWNDKTAWEASEVGARIAFKFTGSSVGIFVWTSNGEGYEKKPGQAACWVDGEKQEDLVTKVDAAYGYAWATSQWRPIAEGLEAGEHVLHCQIIKATSTGGHDFRILGVASR